MATTKRTSPKQTAQPSTKPRTDDVCPLVPPFSLETPVLGAPALQASANLGHAVAERAYYMSRCFHNEEFAGYDAHQSLLSGDEFQLWAGDEREAWTRLFEAIKPNIGKPLTEKIVFEMLAPALAKCAVSSIEMDDETLYAGGEEARDRELERKDSLR